MRMKRTAQILLVIPAVLVLSIAAIAQLNGGELPFGWKQNTDSEQCREALKDIGGGSHCYLASEHPEGTLGGCTDEVFTEELIYDFIKTDAGNCITEYNVLAVVLSAMTGFFIVFYVLFGFGWIVGKLRKKLKN